ncbi:hypothetical protein V6N13_012300 [Hibiscus sabdariffa]|uniref:VAN3-binding protein-like auxin canalisation domain-containing protein n=1 Tax=Hibiscus sabdariffa TaxID=183260 RepID=A0ABR2SEP4_9ROSI
MIILVTTVVTSDGKTVGRWMKDRRKKEETRAHDTQLHATIFISGFVVVVTTIATAITTSSSVEKDEQMKKMDMVVASVATLVIAQCVKVA